MCEYFFKVTPLMIGAGIKTGLNIKADSAKEVGADIIVGSLMKNLGGGIAKTGGYIVGNKDLINDVAERLPAGTIL